MGAGWDLSQDRNLGFFSWWESRDSSCSWSLGFIPRSIPMVGIQDHSCGENLGFFPWWNPGIFLGVDAEGWIPRMDPGLAGLSTLDNPRIAGICPEHREQHQILFFFPGDPNSWRSRCGSVPSVSRVPHRVPCAVIPDYLCSHGIVME